MIVVTGCLAMGEISVMLRLLLLNYGVYTVGWELRKKRTGRRSLLTDSQVVKHLLEGGEGVVEHGLGHIIEECRRIMDVIDCSVHHIYREANFCADMLANLGGKQHLSMKIWEAAPSEILLLLRADSARTAYPRGLA